MSIHSFHRSLSAQYMKKSSDILQINKSKIDSIAFHWEKLCISFFVLLTINQFTDFCVVNLKQINMMIRGLISGTIQWKWIFHPHQRCCRGGRLLNTVFDPFMVYEAWEVISHFWGFLELVKLHHLRDLHAKEVMCHLRDFLKAAQMLHFKNF